jgi:hypothetical protein
VYKVRITVGVDVGCQRHRVPIADPGGKIVELVRLQGSLPRSREILQEVSEVPEAHRMLKRLTRRRQLVNEKVCLLNRMQTDLQAVSPGLADLVEYKDGVAFLRFLSCRNHLEQLKTIRRESLLKIRGIGKSFAGKVQAWQRKACFSAEAPIVSMKARTTQPAGEKGRCFIHVCMKGREIYCWSY